MTKRKVKFAEGTEVDEDRPSKSRRFKVKDHDSDGQWVEVKHHPVLSDVFSCNTCAKTLSARTAAMRHLHWCLFEDRPKSDSAKSCSNSSNQSSNSESKLKEGSSSGNPSGFVPNVVVISPTSMEQKQRGGADTRRKYTNIEKVQILTEVKNGGKPTEIAYKYGINRSLISKWMQKRDFLLEAVSTPEKGNDTKNRRKFKYEKLFDELFKRYVNAREDGIEVNHRWVYNCANEINKEFKPEAAALPPSVASNFTKQYNIQFPRKVKSENATTAATKKAGSGIQVPAGDSQEIIFNPSSAAATASSSHEQVPLSFAIDLKTYESQVMQKSQLTGVVPLPPTTSENHSLDSDEDDVDVNLNCQDAGIDEISLQQQQKKDGGEAVDMLHEDDIEGQEDETIREDDGITVTPFNLKEEMEEGHFDAQGNYVANRNDESVTDGWLDSVDWGRVSANAPKNNEDDESDIPKLNPIKVKQQMVGIMKPSENVFKALRRLGGNKKPVSTADRWKKKKANVQEKPLTVEEKQKKEMLLKLTECADSLLTNGEFQIYEKTYEQLSFEVREKESQFDDAPMEDEGDDEDDALEAAFKGKTADEVKEKRETPVIEEKAVSTSDEVHWYYKDTEEQKELKGPFSSTQMLKWQEEGKFDGGVFCRKANNEGGQFYNSKRLDFELYT